jgi:hypothetical protein
VVSAELASDVADEATIEVSAGSAAEATVESVESVAPEARADPATEERTSAEPVATSAIAKAPTVPAADDEVDLPNFRRRTPGRATLVAIVGGVAALVVAGVAWKRFASDGERAAAMVAAPAPERAPEQAPPRPSPEPAPSPATPLTSEAANSPAPTVEATVATSPEKTANAVAVTIKTVPEEAVIFRAGQRLGTGVVAVNVERNVKQRFTALLDGYTPSNFTVDGSRDSITIMLKRAQKPRAAPARESDSPSADAPSEESKAAAPAATTAPVPESTAAEPDVPPAKSSPE